MELLTAYLQRAKAMEKAHIIRRYLALGFGGLFMFAAGMLVDISINDIELRAWHFHLSLPFATRTAHFFREPPWG